MHARRRAKRLGMLTAAALLLHAASLGGVGWGWPQAEAEPAPAAAMQVRMIEPVVASVPVSPEPDAISNAMPSANTTPNTTPNTMPSVSPRRAPAKPLAPKSAFALPSKSTFVNVEPIPVVATIDEVVRPAAEIVPPPVQLALNAVAEAASAPESPLDEPIPHYRTKLPPASTMRYELLRGMLHGSGDLTWKPDGDHYELKLEGKVGSLPVITQISSGTFDAAGVAPERFTDQRLRRALNAANFQRASGKITFSGPSVEYPLREGAQDRLSWMIQLAAIVAADPKLRVAGAKVTMFIVGSHGEANVWTFRCDGPDAVRSGAGSVDAIKFMREPRDPYDTTVQVWLDPNRFDLPVRATQKSGPTDEGFELRLIELVSSN